MLKPTFVLVAILALGIPLSGQDQTPRLERIPAWGVHIPSGGRWIAVAGIPICAIFVDTGHGRYDHVYGATPPDFVKPKKGFKIGDIQRLSVDDGAIVKIMPRHYRPSDLSGEEQLCSEEHSPQLPPEDK